MTQNSILKVTCAIIRRANLYLAVQRSSTMSMPLKWEFPGGKVELGESEEESIIREIKEELALTISIQKRMEPVTHQYPIFTIELIPFLCESKESAPVLSEHHAYKWCTINELQELDWCEADIPLVKELNLIQ